MKPTVINLLNGGNSVNVCRPSNRRNCPKDSTARGREGGFWWQRSLGSHLGAGLGSS